MFRCGWRRRIRDRPRGHGNRPHPLQALSSARADGKEPRPYANVFVGLPWDGACDVTTTNGQDVDTGTENSSADEVPSRSARWLAYFSLIFAIVSLALHRPLSLDFAIASALCGLTSALLRHKSLVQKVASSFVGKIATAVVAAGGIFVSPWIANTVISEITLMRPSAFPPAYSAIVYIVTVLLWAALIYIALFMCAGFNFIQILRGGASRAMRKSRVKTEIIPSLGRLAGLLVLLLYIGPLFLYAANYDSRGVLSRLVITTSFVQNGSQSFSSTSLASDLPSDCRQLAIEAKLNLTKVYVCSARTIRCANLDPAAEITYLSENEVVVAKDVDRNSPLYELNPVRFDVEQCDSSKRYQYGVTQRP